MTRASILLAAVLVGASAADAPGAGPVRAEVYVDGLDRPIDFVQHPGDPEVQFVAQQNGVVRVVEGGALSGEPLIDASALLDTSGVERGLLSMAVAPDFATSGFFYLHFTEEPNGTSVVAQFQTDATGSLTASMSTRADVISLAQPNAIHNGHCLRFGPDGSLYIAYGDGGGTSDPNRFAQDPTNLYGTIARIDPLPGGGYAVPPDNPFVGEDGRDEVWVYGVRNPWRFTFDEGPCATGSLVVGDVGNFREEELTVLPPDAGGANLGWSCIEGDRPFLGCEPPAGESFTDATFTYDRDTGFGVSVTAGYVYRGREMTRNRGRLFFADFVTGRVFSLRLTFGAGAPVADDLVEHTGELAGDGSPSFAMVSAFGRDAEGELYILDYTGGVVHRVRADFRPADLDASGAVDATDLATLIAAWGDAGCGPADLTGDGTVDATDLAELIADWGG